MSGDEAAQANDSVGIVIVNWNAWMNTIEACQSLERSSHRIWTAIIVDNGSADGSAAEISARLPNAILISSQRNLGFAGGCNLGIARALELGLRYVFLLNNDAMISEDALRNLVMASIRLDDRALLGSAVRYWPSGAFQFFGNRRTARAGRPYWYTWPEDARQLEQALIETDFVFGGALFAPAALFREIGMFDERFFLNYEETDWCYRARNRGIAPYVVSNSVVFHRGSTTLGAADAPLQTYFLCRNRLLFQEKHASTMQRLRGLAEIALQALTTLRRGLRLSLSRGLAADGPSIAMLLALRDYGLGRFGDCPSLVRELAMKHRPQRPPDCASHQP